MCNQTVVLVAAELERRRIATAAIQLLREVAQKVRRRRSLFVPFSATRWMKWVGPHTNCAIPVRRFLPRAGQLGCQQEPMLIEQRESAKATWEVGQRSLG